jgi:hypothetical protein
MKYDFETNRPRELDDLRDLASCLKIQLPSVAPISGVAARIYLTFEPLIAVAQLLGDERFLRELETRLRLDSALLDSDQSHEPDGLIVRALIWCLMKREHGLRSTGNIKLMDIAGTVWSHNRQEVSSQQVGRVLREIGDFKVAESHGLTNVKPNPKAVLKACDEVGYEDEEVVALRKELTGGAGGAGGRFMCAEKPSASTEKTSTHSSPSTLPTSSPLSTHSTRKAVRKRERIRHHPKHPKR